MSLEQTIVWCVLKEEKKVWKKRGALWVRRAHSNISIYICLGIVPIPRIRLYNAHVMVASTNKHIVCFARWKFEIDVVLRTRVEGSFCRCSATSEAFPTGWAGGGTVFSFHHHRHSHIMCYVFSGDTRGRKILQKNTHIFGDSNARNAIKE